MHRPLRREHQPEQADLLAADHPALRTRPMRIVVAAREQVRQFGDRPVGRDRGIGQGPHPFGIEQGRRQQPRWRFFRQRRPREQLELAPARTVVDRLVTALSELGRQAGNQCAMWKRRCPLGVASRRMFNPSMVSR